MSGLVVKVNANNQVTIPKLVRQKLNIKVGDHLLVDVQENLIVLLSRPKIYTSQLQGLHSEIWKDIDTDKYLNDERNAW
jgi:AbrB family looped-hinge helix DNA binding protein